MEPEPLELFSLDALEPTADEAAKPERTEDGPISLISAEHLKVAEDFLDDEGRADDPKARIETAMFLCEGAGDVSASTLQRLTIDQARYPRAASAVDETRETLALPPSKWPEGFWSRFLLRALAES
jgi:hypothetical protein